MATTLIKDASLYSKWELSQEAMTGNHRKPSHKGYIHIKVPVCRTKQTMRNGKQKDCKIPDTGKSTVKQSDLENLHKHGMDMFMWMGTF